MGDPIALVLLVLGAIAWILAAGYLTKRCSSEQRLRGAITDALYELECEGNPTKAAQHLSKAVGE